MLELLRPIVIVIGLVLFEALPEYLSEWFSLNEKWLRVACGAFIVVGILLLDYLFREGSSFQWIRRRRYPISHLEGLWFQHVSIPDRPYSLSRIIYLSHGRWSYCGIAYDTEFRPAAEWSTESLQYDKIQRRWYFAGEASLLRLEAAAYLPHMRGYVTPIFQLTNEGFKSSRLNATVVDLDVAEKRLVFAITLIRADDLYPYRLPSIETMKHLPPDQVKDLFSRKNMIDGAPAPKAPKPK